MATSFSGERRRSTQRERPTMGKQLVNFTTCCCESSAPFFVIYQAGCEPTPYWWYACMSCYVMQLPNSLSHPGPLIIDEKSKYFSYIMAVSLLVEETGVPIENHRPVASHWNFITCTIIPQIWYCKCSLDYHLSNDAEKRKLFYPMRAASFVSILLYLIYYVVSSRPRHERDSNSQL
jgi:hypothetical protein